MSNCKSLLFEELLSTFLVWIRAGSSSGDGGVKYLASSLTLDGPILLLGGS